jgi:hypothetical protein
MVLLLHPYGSTCLFRIIALDYCSFPLFSMLSFFPFPFDIFFVSMALSCVLPHKGRAGVDLRYCMEFDHT